MRYLVIPARPLLLALAIECAGTVAGQGLSGSPYSAYGFGDLLYTSQVSQSLMGGVGIAFTEPFSVLSSNPASYVGLQRPTFEGGVRSQFVRQSTLSEQVSRTDANFTGFNIGVPFGRGHWALALGLSPYSDVAYTITDPHPFQEGTVTYRYTGSGGMNRAFAGLSRMLWQHTDSAGELHGRCSIGANFEFLFGSIEQTRDAIYPVGFNYVNTDLYNSLVLRAPTGTFGALFSDLLVPRARAEAGRQARIARREHRLALWRLAHVDTTRMPFEELRRWRNSPTLEDKIAWLRSTTWEVHYTDSLHVPEMKDPPEASSWRWSLGASVAPPTRFSALNNNQITTYIIGSSSVPTTLDTVPSPGAVDGSITLPLAWGVGLSVENARWLYTVEMRRRDWSALQVNVEGFSFPAPLKASTVYALGARFQPATEGSVLLRTVYRTGLRYTQDYLQVHGSQLTAMSASAGISIPINAAQTNSFVHLGVEYGIRGTTDNGLLRERSFNVWAGVSITPWKGERWFRRYQIQ